eukprot:4881382-Prymnesium_polylepis.2
MCVRITSPAIFKAHAHAGSSSVSAGLSNHPAGESRCSRTRVAAARARMSHSRTTPSRRAGRALYRYHSAGSGCPGGTNSLFCAEPARSNAARPR